MPLTKLNSASVIDRLPVGSVIQTKNTTVSTHTTETTHGIPADDTIATSSEGKEVMTLSITPISASSKLLIKVVMFGSSRNDAVMTAALFQDSGSASIAQINAYQSTGTGTHALQFNHYMTSGTTSATTFKVRGGVNSGTFTFNGHSEVRQLGGIASSSIIIQEIKQ